MHADSSEKPSSFDWRLVLRPNYFISHSLYLTPVFEYIKVNEKSAQRDANTVRALPVVRFGHRPLSQSHRQDRLQYTAPQLASAQCNN